MTKTIHFSIDDCTLTNSSMFARLASWRKSFGLKVTLYCYADSLAAAPDTRFFQDNADWLKLGFHSKDIKPFSEDADYRNSYSLALKEFRRLQGGQTAVLRLHCWKVTDEQAEFLSSAGVSRILVPGDETEARKFGMTYSPTDVRFEHLHNISAESLYVGKPEIIAFTHEWCFSKNNIISALLRWLPRFIDVHPAPPPLR